MICALAHNNNAIINSKFAGASFPEVVEKDKRAAFWEQTPGR